MAPHLLFLLFLLSEAASDPEVKVEQVGPKQPGQNVTLKCHTDVVNIIAVEWTRSDLEDPNYVLFQSDGHSDPTYQDSSFKDRVQLVDGELKTGDVSLILKDVKKEDVGTYECRVKTAGSRRKKRANIDSKPISRVKLLVTDPENNNHGGLAAAVVVSLLVAAAVGLFLVRKCKRQREKKPEPSAAEETGDNLL